MNASSRIWVIVAVLLSVAIVALGWVVGVSPKLTEAATADSQRSSVEANNQLQEIQLAKIKEQFENIDGLRSQLDELHLQVPKSADLARFVGELHSLEQATGATIQTLTASDPQLFVPGLDGTGQTVEGAEKLTDGRFIVIPVAITLTGTQANIMDFISGLQTGERLVLVTNLAITNATIVPEESPVGVDNGETGPPESTASISGYMYVLLDTPPETEKAEPVPTTGDSEE